jgi:hypothetical protein
MIAEFDQRCPSLVQVWTSLRNENTTTIDKLMAVAGRLERLVGVGRRQPSSFGTKSPVSPRPKSDNQARTGTVVCLFWERPLYGTDRLEYIRPKEGGPYGVQSGKRSGLADLANSSGLAQSGKPAVRMRSSNCLRSADLDAPIDQGQNETWIVQRG